MTRKLLISMALLTVGVTSQYTNATIPWNKDLDCTACIRAGYDFCLTGPTKTSATSWTCNFGRTSPEYVMPSGGLNNGYVCSNALNDQVNAIVNGCRPYIGDADHRLGCGDYWIDLTQNSFMSK